VTRFLLFFWAPVTIIFKKVFLPVKDQKGWLHNVSGVPWTHFFLVLIGQQGLEHFFGYWPRLHIGWKILQTIRQWQGKPTNKTLLTLSKIPSAGQSSFIMDQLYSTCCL
jgi:hypothetical protein